MAKDGETHITLTNIDASKTQEVAIEVNGTQYKSVYGRILTSKNLQDYNSFEKPLTIIPSTFKNVSLKGNQLKVKLPPFSVVVLELI